MNATRCTPWKVVAVLCAALFAHLPLGAWDYEGHRIVNRLALAGLPQDFPAFATTRNARERIAFLSGEMDRWRNSPEPTFLHATTPDHYINLELLERVGLDPHVLTPYRHDFIAQFAAARAGHAEALGPIDPDKNKDHTREWPGFLPWAINEQFALLQSECSSLKTYQQNGGTAAEVANAEANVIYTMGVLGHLIGDGAQPLHTTLYFNGWAGANPSGFTTSRTLHSWIDGGYIAKVGLTFAQLRSQARPARRLEVGNGADGRPRIFTAALDYLFASNAQVAPLYALEKDGGFSGDGAAGLRGRDFIADRLLAAGEMLASLWRTAWDTASLDTHLLHTLQQRARKPAKEADEP